MTTTQAPSMTDEALHACARLLLRICSPRRAHEILRCVGDCLPRHRHRSAVLRAGRRLRQRGTCLSRALAVVARVPEAQLVIGVLPNEGEGLRAHAWVELFGQAIDPSEVSGIEIARF